jgi:dolichol-phosphate mannosyltransferase
MNRTHDPEKVSTPGTHRVLCIIPAYDEWGKIGPTVRGFTAVKEIAEVLVVDDCSTDGTGEEARAGGATVLRHDRRRGVGAGIRTGIDYARAHGFDIVMTAAGNNKDHPDETPLLLAPIIEGGYDYVQGSRYMAGGNPGKMPFHRVICTRMYPYLIRIILGFPATEGTNGFRAYRTSLFEDRRINLWQDWLDGVELEYYLQVQVIRLGYRVIEVPVSKTYPSVRMKDYRHYTKANPWGILSNLKPICYLTLGIRK